MVYLAKEIAWLNKWKAVYLGPNGDPLWFTIGQDSEEIIPTSVYFRQLAPSLKNLIQDVSE